MSKTCTKCFVEKPLTEFYKAKGYKGGHQTSCKSCNKEYNRLKYLKNKPQISERNKAWVENNRDRKREINLRSSRKNSAERYARLKSWREINQDKVRCHNAKYRSSKQSATPMWLTEEQLQQISDVYLLARECEILTGDKYHVDHVVPLNGESVCGLHVPWNLQVLPSDVNIRKSNKAAFS